MEINSKHMTLPRKNPRSLFLLGFESIVYAIKFYLPCLQIQSNSMIARNLVTLTKHYLLKSIPNHFIDIFFNEPSFFICEITLSTFL